MPLGFVKEPVKFRILKPVNGVPRTAYANGVFATRDRKMIAMLRRLPDDHVMEIADKLAAEIVTQNQLEAERSEINYYPSKEEAEDLSWVDLRHVGERRGIYKIGITRVELEEAVAEKPLPAERRPIQVA